MDLEISSDSRTCTFLPSRGAHLTPGLNCNINNTEAAVKWNGVHSPISVKSRLNLSIEVPSASQVKPENIKLSPVSCKNLGLSYLDRAKKIPLHFFTVHSKKVLLMQNYFALIKGFLKSSHL